MPQSSGRRDTHNEVADAAIATKNQAAFMGREEGSPKEIESSPDETTRHPTTDTIGYHSL